VELYHPVQTAKECSDQPKDGGAYILPDKSVCIGYGTTGTRPVNFNIPDGKELDLGHLLLYVSTSPLSLKHVEMPSPFRAHTGSSGSTNHSRGAEFAEPPPGNWAVQKISVVIRKRSRAS
jgi:hypothetical protein